MTAEYAEKVAYSIAEAVKATGIGRTSIFAEIKAGRLHAVKVGSRTIVPIQSLRGWLATMPSTVAKAS